MRTIDQLIVLSIGEVTKLREVIANFPNTPPVIDPALIADENLVGQLDALFTDAIPSGGTITTVDASSIRIDFTEEIDPVTWNVESVNLLYLGRPLSRETVRLLDGNKAILLKMGGELRDGGEYILAFEGMKTVSGQTLPDSIPFIFAANGTSPIAGKHPDARFAGLNR